PAAKPAAEPTAEPTTAQSKPAAAIAAAATAAFADEPAAKPATAPDSKPVDKPAAEPTTAQFKPAAAVASTANAAFADEPAAEPATEPVDPASAQSSKFADAFATAEFTASAAPLATTQPRSAAKYPATGHNASTPSVAAAARSAAEPSTQPSAVGAAEPAAAQPAATQPAASLAATATTIPPTANAASVEPSATTSTQLTVPASCSATNSSTQPPTVGATQPTTEPSTGLGVFELATVPDTGLRIDSIICRFGRLASSNAAIAFKLGAHSCELYATSLYVDGALQSRVNALTTLGDGTTIIRQENRIEIALGRVLVDVKVQFNELAGRQRVSRVGWWQNVRVYSPIRDVLDPELTGLCARNVSSPRVGVDEVPMLASNETVFDTKATRYTDLIANCGFDVPSPPLCDNPGTESCCPALPTLDDAEGLCSFALCDGEAYPRCLYDCCLSGVPECPAAAEPTAKSHSPILTPVAPRAATAQPFTIPTAPAPAERSAAKYPATGHKASTFASVSRLGTLR
ncbi:hypothetical protein T492DRAFT_892157, partial [Pavlovales sp. CCMP2436]